MKIEFKTKFVNPLFLLFSPSSAWKVQHSKVLHGNVRFAVLRVILFFFSIWLKFSERRSINQSLSETFSVGVYFVRLVIIEVQMRIKQESSFSSFTMRGYCWMTKYLRSLLWFLFFFRSQPVIWVSLKNLKAGPFHDYILITESEIGIVRVDARCIRIKRSHCKCRARVSLDWCCQMIKALPADHF